MRLIKTALQALSAGDLSQQLGVVGNITGLLRLRQQFAEAFLTFVGMVIIPQVVKIG
jgi:hypothetical protein